MSRLDIIRGLISAVALGMLALPAQALFKVVGPDGSITYTDREPAASAGRVTPVGRDQRAGEGPASPLPLELRQVVARFPVTFYTSGDCQPCESGRRLLAQRGVPLTERLITNDDDAEALQRLTGGRTVPALIIGSQALRGYSETDWHGYLDAAGYPRESRLPKDYRAVPPTPLVARQPEPAAPAPLPSRANTPAPTELAAPAPGNIRF